MKIYNTGLNVTNLPTIENLLHFKKIANKKRKGQYVDKGEEKLQDSLSYTYYQFAHKEIEKPFEKTYSARLSDNHLYFQYNRCKEFVVEFYNIHEARTWWNENIEGAKIIDVHHDFKYQKFDLVEIDEDIVKSALKYSPNKELDNQFIILGHIHHREGFKFQVGNDKEGFYVKPEFIKRVVKKFDRTDETKTLYTLEEYFHKFKDSEKLMKNCS